MPHSNTSDEVAATLRGIATSAPPGTRLPSVRALMARHRVGPATVQRAVAALAAEGVLVARPGRGTFVAARRQADRRADLAWQTATLGSRPTDAAALGLLAGRPRPGALPLSSGWLSPDLQPRAQLAAAISRAARRPGAWDPQPVEGVEELRAWFAREIGPAARTHNVLVTTGGQAALATAFRALAEPGAPVLVESPSYLGALAAARAADLRPVPVPVDRGGVDPELLADAFAASGARLFYAQPTYPNPHGASLAADRRSAVLDAARAARAFIVEDDWARTFALQGAPPPPLVLDDEDGHVVYVRSLTKPTAPGLRVGALHARGAARVRLADARVVDDFFVSGPLQHAAVELVTAPGWPRHLNTVRAALRERSATLAQALVEQLPELGPVAAPAGGLHLWVRLPDGLDDARVAEDAAAAGVLVTPGSGWFPAEPTGAFLRLSYGSADSADLDAGVSTLARVVRGDTLSG